MLPQLQSAILQASGYALVNSIWQFALLWLLFELFQKVIKLSSDQKYNAGLLLQGTGTVWFISNFLFRYYQGTADSMELGSLMSGHTFFNSAIFRQMISSTEGYLAYLSILYFGCLAFHFAKWIVAYRQTQRLRTFGLHKIGVDWRLFVKRTAALLGIKKEVAVFVSDLVAGPLTIGFIKPVILVPVATLNNLTPEQMEAVLLHELAHIRRSDYVANLVLAIVEVVLFFNPFMWLISKQIRKDRENCCDEVVLQFQYKPYSYSKALLAIAAEQSTSVFALSAADNRNLLLNRVQRIMGLKEKKSKNSRNFFFAMLTMTFLVATMIISRETIINSPIIKSLASTVGDDESRVASRSITNGAEPKSHSTPVRSYVSESSTVSGRPLPEPPLPASPDGSAYNATPPENVVFVNQVVSDPAETDETFNANVQSATFNEALIAKQQALIAIKSTLQQATRKEISISRLKNVTAQIISDYQQESDLAFEQAELAQIQAEVAKITSSIQQEQAERKLANYSYSYNAPRTYFKAARPENVAVSGSHCIATAPNTIIQVPAEVTKIEEITLTKLDTLTNKITVITKKIKTTKI